ncbi:PI-PLC X domain-containing protein 1 [Balamuthia mandrillaris]
MEGSTNEEVIRLRVRRLSPTAGDDGDDDSDVIEEVRPHRWMEDMAPWIGHKTLKEVALPGTHDSATYCLTSRSSFAPDASSFVQRMPKRFVRDWAVTQSLSLYQQLQAGIRYLDLRIGRSSDRFPNFHSLVASTTKEENKERGTLRKKEEDEKEAEEEDEEGDEGETEKPSSRTFVPKELFTCHALFGAHIQDELSSVLRFLRENKKEVVLLDLNHFYAMSESSHRLLEDLIQQTFGSLLIPRLSHTTTARRKRDRAEEEALKLNELWKSEKRVLVFYHHRTSVQRHRWLWPRSGISSPWPNTTHLPELKQKLHQQLVMREEKRRSNAEGGELPFFVLQGVLTPDVSFICKGIFNVLGKNTSLKRMASNVSPLVLQWVEEEWADQFRMNVVMLDFFESTKLVELCLLLNMR